MKVATGKRHPVRSVCRNFGRVLRGWPWKCLEEGQVTFRMKVATGKRHPSDSRLHAKSRSRDRRRPGIREAHSQANTARPGAAGVLRGQSTPTI